MVGRSARLAGFFLLICLLIPAVRRALVALSSLALVLSVLMVIGLVGFGLYRLAGRNTGRKKHVENPFAAPATVAADAPEQKWDENELVLAPDPVSPASRRRHPWRR